MAKGKHIPGDGSECSAHYYRKCPTEENETKRPVLQSAKCDPDRWVDSVPSKGSSVLDSKTSSRTDCAMPKCTPYPASASVSLSVVSRPVAYFRFQGNQCSV